MINPDVCSCCGEIWNKETLKQIPIGTHTLLLCPDCHTAFTKSFKAIKTGHWIDLNAKNDGHCDDDGNPYVKCSECGEPNGTNRSEYCPQCGCWMIE